MADYSQLSTTYPNGNPEGVMAQPWPQVRTATEMQQFTPEAETPRSWQVAPPTTTQAQPWLREPPTYYTQPTPRVSARVSPEYPMGLQLGTGLSPEAVENPQSLQENYQGSLKALLTRNIGFFVVASFLIGTQNTVSWEGILYSVGNDYLVIWQEDLDRFIIGNIYSLKFVELHDTRTNPECQNRSRNDVLRGSLG